MNAFRFSDKFNDLTAINLSELEKNNFSNMQLLKSIYDDSYDDAELFIGNKGGKKYNNNYEEVKSVNKNNNNYVLK